jgi:hypothetical protein
VPFPADADGETLERVAEHADLSKPMNIDFMVVVPSEEAGDKVAVRVSKLGYVPVVEFDALTSRWTCYCAKFMLATYDGVVAAQRELDDISRDLGGRSDGWGTVGNDIERITIRPPAVK